MAAKLALVTALLCALSSALGKGALAAEVQETPDIAPAETPEVASQEASAPMSEEEISEAKAAGIVDSARDLQEKLAQLRALLDKKGDGADPALKERLDGLTQQLSGLGLGSLVGEEQPSSPELREFLGSCVMMSMRRSGMQRPATIGALAKLADTTTTPERAGDFELVRMVASCVNELTDEELSDSKKGKLQVLPKHLAAKAADPESKAEVLKIEAPVWAELQVVAAAMQKQIMGDAEVQKPPIMQGLMAGIPVLGMVIFLATKFNEMQKREVIKKDKHNKKQK
jgi:hypothetical protein